MDIQKLSGFFSKNYKLILIVPILILLLALGLIVNFYMQNGDFIHRDISLTGGTTITVFTSMPSAEIQTGLKDKIPDLETRYLTDNLGKQNQVILLTSKSPDEALPYQR